MTIPLTILEYEELTSTNDELKNLFERGSGEGTVVWAHTQNRGRGRLGRRWISEPGNLFFSILLRPKVDLQQVGQLSFVAAVAVGEALKHGLKETITYKWPNDILVGGQKIAGILLESIGSCSDPALIMGIGVNITCFPDQVIYPCTCFNAHANQPITASQCLTLILQKLSFFYTQWEQNGFSGIHARWLRSAHGLDQQISIRGHSSAWQWFFKGIDPNGCLIVHSPAGEETRVSSADIFF